MPAKDLYHDTVKTALEKDGWTVTDSLPLKAGKRDLFIDLGAEKLLVAQRENQKIAVEVKSFISASPVADLEQALGQYLLYEDLMRTQESGFNKVQFFRKGLALPNPYNEKVVQVI